MAANIIHRNELLGHSEYSSVRVLICSQATHSLRCISGLRSNKRRFIFCLQQQQQTVLSLNDDLLVNGQVSATCSNTSLIAHALGDIRYFCVTKKALWAPPSLVATANASMYRLIPFSKRLLQTVVQ